MHNKYYTKQYFREINIDLMVFTNMEPKQELFNLKAELDSICQFIERATEDLRELKLRQTKLEYEYSQFMQVELAPTELNFTIKDSFIKRIAATNRGVHVYTRNLQFLEGLVGLLESKIAAVIDQIIDEEQHL
jgi:hypothetical protein